MNFIDRYKQELEEETKMTIDDMTPEQIEQLKGALAHAMFTAPQSKEQQRRELKEDMTVLANTFADCADIFLTRLKGKLPYKQIVQIILAFFQTIEEGIQ